MAVIEIRDCTMSDREAFLRLMEQVHTLHHSSRPDVYRPAERELLEDYFDREWKNEASEILIALYDGVTAGLCVLAFRAPSSRNPVLLPRKIGYIDDFCVDEAYARKGVGRALFAEAERRCRDVGMDGMELMAWSFNQTAIHFYEAMGMSEKYRVLEKEL